LNFSIESDIFRGPVDLLLYLVRRHEVEVSKIALADVTEKYLEYIDVLKEISIDTVGDFLEVASILIELKARAMLPRPEAEEDHETEVVDPRKDLVQRLLLFKRFKDASDDLQRLEIEREKVYTRRPGSIPIDPLPMGNRLEASIFDLVGAVNELLRRVAEREGAKGEIVEDPWSVSEKIVTIRERLGQEGRLKFSGLFDGAHSRGEVVATFLALLELVRLRQLMATQDNSFGEIEIVVAPVELQQIKPEQLEPETVTT